MGGLFDGLISWSVHNRFVVMLGAAGLVVAGLWSAAHASLDVLPDFTPPFVVVQTEAASMATLDVEQLVTRPLEQVLLGTPQTTAVRSASTPGLSVITLFFEEGVDVYRARQFVTERLQLAQARLPQAVQAPQLMPIMAPIGALVRFCLTSDQPNQEQALKDLRTFADWTLRPRILAIPGVAQVMPLGGLVERVEVRPDPTRLRQRGVSMADVTAAVRASQSVTGAGFAETASARLDVQNDARLRLEDAITKLSNTAIPVSPTPAAASPRPAPVRLGDVADVVFSNEPSVGAALYDGKPAVFVQVNKLPDADTVAVTRQVEQALRDLANALPEGARIEPPLFRQATFVATSLRSVGSAMLIGSILVIVILVSFLRYGRLAVISLTAIPLSILTAAGVLIAFGASINGMTLGGLAIAVGEVVDDAIVDVENVWRRLRENAKLPQPAPALDIVRAASREIRSSVVYATIIVAIVLVPVLSLGGIAGRIFSPLAHAYILAISASLLVALTVTPAMCAWLLPPLAAREPRLSRLAVWTLDRYRRVVRTVVDRPRTVFVTIAILAIGAAIALPFIGGRFLPEFHETSLVGHVTAVPGTSLTESTRLAAAVDAQLRQSGVASHTSASMGRTDLSEDALPVYALEFNIALKDLSGEWEDIVLNAAKAIGHVPGLAFTVEAFLGERINEVLSGETAPVVVKIIGPDLQRLRALAANVAGTAAQTPGLGAIRADPQIDVPQIRIRPDDVQLARYGVTPADLASDVIGWRQGETATEILERDGRVVNVAIAGPPATRDRGALGDLPVDTAHAGPVNLGALARIEEVPAPALINHENGDRRIAIGIDVPGGGLSSAVSDLEERLNAIRLPQGYRIDVSGEALARREAARQLLLIGALVLLGIFMLLAVAFTSIRDAVVTMINFPLGLIGGVVGALVTPEGLSVAGLVGFVTLFGIIARNGIMLVAHKQLLDAENPEDDPVARILRASEERLLPILMTAGAAGLGLLPLALSFESSGSELEAPMALIVVLGLVTSTALNMLVIPTIYVWLERRAQRKRTAAA
jgi:CzcA family heavy metal efflux pump